MLGVWTVLLAFAAASFGTRVAVDWLANRDLVAVENDRTMHTGAVPQGGGIPVVATMVAVTLLVAPWTRELCAAAVIAVGLAVMSAVNDRRDIAFPIRLAAHAIAAFAGLELIAGGKPVLGGLLPLVLDHVLAAVGLVWFINLYNFMDGIDGITGVETISIALGGLIVLAIASAHTPLDGMMLAVVGASAGFLVWNWHKARIFLGDVGSVPLGFLTGMFLVCIAADVSLAAALILPAYYLTDATLTLIRRFMRGENIWQAHRVHAYQRAARAAGSHVAIVLRIAACNVALVVAAVLALSLPVPGLAAAAAIVALLMRDLEAIAAKGAETAVIPPAS